MNGIFIKLYEHLSIEAQSLLVSIDSLLRKTMGDQLQEKIWSKMPMYYIGSKSIILALFNDHINIVSNPAIYKKDGIHENAIIMNKALLEGYSITPKGMLQIYTNQCIPTESLIEIFRANFR